MGRRLANVDDHAASPVVREFRDGDEAGSVRCVSLGGSHARGGGLHGGAARGVGTRAPRAHPVDRQDAQLAAVRRRPGWAHRRVRRPSAVRVHRPLLRLRHRRAPRGGAGLDAADSRPRPGAAAHSTVRGCQPDGRTPSSNDSGSAWSNASWPRSAARVCRTRAWSRTSPRAEGTVVRSRAPPCSWTVLTACPVDSAQSLRPGSVQREQGGGARGDGELRSGGLWSRSSASSPRMPATKRSGHVTGMLAPGNPRSKPTRARELPVT